MKKLLCTLISVLTSAAFLSPACDVRTYAETLSNEAVDYDFSDDSLTLTTYEDFTITPSVQSAVLSNYSDGMHIYKDCLDANNVAVYEAFSSLAEPSVDKITVVMPEAFTFTLSALPGSLSYSTSDMETYSSAIYANCQPGIDAMLFDMPEVFWLDEPSLQISVADSSTSRNVFTKTYTVTIRALSFQPSYTSAYSSLDNVYEYKDALETAVENIAAGATGVNRYEKIKYIHDYIVDYTYYDINADFSSSAVGAVVQPGVVCEGYSKAFKLVCDYLGIPCVVVFGNYDESTRTAHMWDYVQMEDGKWYGMDVTWDDSSSSYNYFMKGSNSFFTTHDEEPNYNFSVFTYPTISKKDYDPSTAPVTTSSTTTSMTTTTTSTTTTATTSTTTSAESLTTVSESTTTSAAATSTTSASTTKPATKTTTGSTTTETTATTTAPETVTATSETTTAETMTTTETTSAVPSDTTTAVSTTTVPETETSVTSTTTTAQEPLDGDLNEDGEVNVADLVCCIKAILADGVTVHNCDYNKDGVVDIFDVILMRQLIARVVYGVVQN